MKCPECIKGGKKSRVYPGMQSTTLVHGVSYYDENGQYQHFDPNVRTTRYSCSNGHAWEVKEGGCR